MPSELCRAVASIPVGVKPREWTFNDEIDSNYHGVVKLTESSLYLQLSWRESHDAPIRPVGVFRLDLPGLLANGFIREEPVGSDGEEVRVRIVRAPIGRFYIQVNQAGEQLLMPEHAPNS